MAQDTRRRRVGSELHRLLNELLRTSVKDPRLDDVTVSEVEMSGDLGVAKVYFTMLDPESSADDAQAAFGKASGFLRGRIGHALRLRRTPELHFVRDDSARQGAELTRLIDSLNVTDDAPASEERELRPADDDEADRSDDDPPSRADDTPGDDTPGDAGGGRRRGPDEH